MYKYRLCCCGHMARVVSQLSPMMYLYLYLWCINTGDVVVDIFPSRCFPPYVSSAEKCCSSQARWTELSSSQLHRSQGGQRSRNKINSAQAISIMAWRLLYSFPKKFCIRWEMAAKSSRPPPPPPQRPAPQLEGLHQVRVDYPTQLFLYLNFFFYLSTY